MKTHKHHIIELLKSRGHHDHAAEAEASLPDELDTDEHEDNLKRWGVSTNDISPASSIGIRRMGL
ncbi:hypothetical protein [Angustibacter luteus]|uniref:Uncharacterized protein n=1 Tax=Angustibacter luteus TaxID=658456 RepID=A0ABW1JBK8_9ACTN